MPCITFTKSAAGWSATMHVTPAAVPVTSAGARGLRTQLSRIWQAVIEGSAAGVDVAPTAAADVILVEFVEKSPTWEARVFVAGRLVATMLDGPHWLLTWVLDGVDRRTWSSGGVDRGAW